VGPFDDGPLHGSFLLGCVALKNCGPMDGHGLAGLFELAVDDRLVAPVTSRGSWP